MLGLYRISEFGNLVTFPSPSFDKFYEDEKMKDTENKLRKYTIQSEISISTPTLNHDIIGIHDRFRNCQILIGLYVLGYTF